MKKNTSFSSFMMPFAVKFIMLAVLIGAVFGAFIAVFKWLSGELPFPALHNTRFFEVFTLSVCSGAVFLVLYTYFFIYRQMRSFEKAIYSMSNSLFPESGRMPRKNHPLDQTVEILISRRKELYDRELKAEVLQKEAELSALQGQINPHFLYNTLESIRGLALMKDIPEIAEMTETLAAMFRSNIRKAGVLVTLTEEIESVENYMRIQGFRFVNKFSFYKHFDMNDEEMMSCRIPHFTLQPIIENSVHHGLEPIIEKGEIHMYAYTTSKYLVLRITDNGIGIAPERLDDINAMLDNDSRLPENITDHKSTGIALYNINQRIKMHFGREYGLTIASTVNVGTQTEIVLPLTYAGAIGERI